MRTLSLKPRGVGAKAGMARLKAAMAIGTSRVMMEVMIASSLDYEIFNKAQVRQ
jgi:hypothetical protein